MRQVQPLKKKAKKVIIIPYITLSLFKLLCDLCLLIGAQLLIAHKVTPLGGKKKDKKAKWSSCSGAEETNPTRDDEVAGSIPGLVQWVKGLALP